MLSYINILLLAGLLACGPAGSGERPAKPASSAKTVTAAEETGNSSRTNGFALIEMFTSEGCMNCPPAYVVAQNLVNKSKAENKKVYLLDFHVDYWNNLGWVDPYSDKMYSDRQLKYSRIFKDDGLYTPQMVVNGQDQFVGSDSVTANDVVVHYLKEKPKSSVKIDRVIPGDSVTLVFNAASIPDNTVINIALVQAEATTNVLKGENAGKTLTHHNVVRVFTRTPVTEGQYMVKLPGYKMPADQKFSVVAYLQDSKSMAILAADGQDIR